MIIAFILGMFTGAAALAVFACLAMEDTDEKMFTE